MNPKYPPFISPGALVTLRHSIPSASLRENNRPDVTLLYNRKNRIFRGDLAMVVKLIDGDCMVTTGDKSGWLTPEAFEVLQCT